MTRLAGSKLLVVAREFRNFDYAQMARHMTDMEVVSTYEGTDTIQSLIVGRDVTGISAFR